MSTRADQFRANALHEVGEDYQWGKEGTGGVAGNDEYDCSGFTWAMLNDVGVKMARTTAEGFRKRGKAIIAPSMVGADFGVLLRPDGTAHHIAPFIGKDEVVEAKGEAYGVVKTTVAAFHKRGARWYRFPDVNLGSLTGANPVPSPRAYPGHLITWGSKDNTSTRWIQKRLNAHGIHVAVNGVFARETYAATTAFRHRYGWHGGTVGPQTWKALAS